MKGEFSGGTAASLRATLGSLKTNPEMFNILVDPFTLCDGFKGPDQPVDNKPFYDEVLKQWSAPFFMAPINTKMFTDQITNLILLMVKTFCMKRCLFAVKWKRRSSS